MNKAKPTFSLFFAGPSQNFGAHACLDPLNIPKLWPDRPNGATPKATIKGL